LDKAVKVQPPQVQMVRTEHLRNSERLLSVAAVAVPLGHPRVQTVLMPQQARQHLLRMVAAVALRMPMAQVVQAQPTVATAHQTQVAAVGVQAKMAQTPPVPPAGAAAVLAQVHHSQVRSHSMDLALEAVLGTQRAQRPQVVQGLVMVEMRTALQVTVHIIAVAVAVAVAVAATPRTEVTAGQVSSSYALQAWTTMIGRLQHGSTLLQPIMA